MATRAARVPHGEVFTRRWVVELMLDLAGYTTDKDLTAERVVEPSVGSGAFVGPILDRLIASRAAHFPDADWSDLTDCLRAWDLQADHVDTCRKLAVQALIDAGCPPGIADSLAVRWLHAGDFLLSQRDGYTATLVVGNPPYIRIEDLAAELLDAYRRSCPTMGGRADIFVGFYERGLDMLLKNGRLVFICADRWMRNDYGKALRAKVVDGFAVDTVLVMHDVDAFEAEVSAYPAITVLRNGKQSTTVTADTAEAFGEAAAAEFLAWARSKRKAVKTTSFDAARLHTWHTTDNIWPTGSAATLAWLDELHERFEPLERADGLTSLKIGVATGNDSVFVVGPRDIPDIERDRLLPIALNKDVKSGKFVWGGRYLVDPWKRTSVLIDLDRYPRAAAYLRQHEVSLQKRHTAKSGKWWKTIDAVHHNRLQLPYVVLRT